MITLNECNGDFSLTVARVDQFASFNKVTLGGHERPHIDRETGAPVTKKDRSLLFRPEKATW